MNIIILIWLGLSLFPIMQEETTKTQSIYLLGLIGDAYRIVEIKLNVYAETSEEIYTSPVRAEQAFSDLVSEGELTELKDHAVSSNFFSEEEIKALTQSKPNTRLTTLRVSPDGDQIAVVKEIEICLRYPRLECFGSSHLLLLSPQNRTTEVIFQIDYQSNLLLSEKSDLWINDVLWFPDHSALLLSICSYRRSPYWDGCPLVVVPTDKTRTPFYLADGNAWAVHQNSKEIAVLDCTEGCVLNRFSVDVQNVSFSSKSHNLAPYFINPEVGIAYQDQRVFIPIHSDLSQGDRVAGGGLGVFDMQTEVLDVVPFSELPLRPSKVRASSTSQIVIEDTQNQLWHLTFEDDQPHFTLVESEVEWWDWSSGEELLVKFSNDQAYSIINLAGHYLNQVDLFTIIAVDW